MKLARALASRSSGREESVAERQRRCDTKPRVGAQRLPWEDDQNVFNPNGVVSTAPAKAATSLGLRTAGRLTQGSLRQPWALRRNAVGVRRLTLAATVRWLVCCLAAFAAASLKEPLPVMAATIVQQAYVKASNSEANDYFGSSVAASGDTLVIGAWLEDSNASGVNGDQSDNSAFSSGAAYIFVRAGTNWTQQAYLKASNAERVDRFGFSVAVSDDTVVIGAYEESCSAMGVNGNQSDDSAGQSGA